MAKTSDWSKTPSHRALKWGVPPVLIVSSDGLQAGQAKAGKGRLAGRAPGPCCFIVVGCHRSLSGRRLYLHHARFSLPQDADRLVIIGMLGNEACSVREDCEEVHVCRGMSRSGFANPPPLHGGLHPSEAD